MILHEMNTVPISGIVCLWYYRDIT